jgi:hypothetical protein
MGKGQPRLVGHWRQHILHNSSSFDCSLWTCPYLIYTFGHRLALARPIGEHLTIIAHSFIDISIAFNIPLVLRQQFTWPNLLRSSSNFFLVTLLGMQISFITVAGIAILLFDKQPLKKSSTIAVYFWIQFLLWITVSNSHSADNLRQLSNKELFNGCKSYTSVVDFVIPATQEVNFPGLAVKFN